MDREHAACASHVQEFAPQNEHINKQSWWTRSFTVVRVSRMESLFQLPVCLSWTFSTVLTAKTSTLHGHAAATNFWPTSCMIDFASFRMRTRVRSGTLHASVLVTRWEPQTCSWFAHVHLAVQFQHRFLRTLIYIYVFAGFPSSRKSKVRVRLWLYVDEWKI